MKALFIGGTGTISTAISKKLLEEGWDLYLLNRGNRNDVLPAGAHTLIVEDVNDEAAVAEVIKDFNFDVVCDFIAFVPAQLERDYRLFQNKTKQFMDELRCRNGNLDIVCTLPAYGKEEL